MRANAVIGLSSIVTACIAANTFGQGAVSINLGTSNVSNGLTSVNCCDGNISPANIGGIDCRKNVNTSTDLYFYFAISDSFAFAGNKPDLYITVHYYDTGTGTLTLQYDATSSAFKTGPSVALANSNTWKLYSFHVTDGYFGNRQNGGADFRINRSTAGNFYMDLAYVRWYCNGPPCVEMTPGQGPAIAPTPFRDLFTQSSQWTTARSKVDIISYADHHINSLSDAELSSYLPQIQGWGKRFFIGTGALKEWCGSGAACFNAERPAWDRFQANGGHIDGFAMDEPLTNVRAFGYGTTQFAYEQTAEFMKLVRNTYPGVQIGLIEAYPYNSASSLQSFVTNLNNRCAVIGTEGIDYFQLDPDWRTFPGSGNWTTVKQQLEDWCKARGIPFSLLYWASNTPNSTNDCDWYNNVLAQGNTYKNTGGTPDSYDIDSWLNIPAATVPDNGNCTFTRSVKDFVDQHVPGGGGGGGGQSPFGGTPRNIPGTIQAEDFDNGGEGVAYHDTTSGNTSGLYRSTDVDVEACVDTGGGHNISFMETGEWLEYTVNVVNTGDHTFKLRVATCCYTSQFHLRLNGNPITGVKSFNATGGWQTFSTILVPAVFLTAGNNQVLQVYLDAGGWNLNKIDVSYGGADAVHVDLDTTALDDGMTHISCCDGNTTAASIGGHFCRRNTSNGPDRYMYFTIFDAYAFQGNRPNVWITAEYYDTGTSTLTLQYDSSSSPYQNASGNPVLTNTNTWKTKSWNVTNGYFGNRQNSGADFRLNMSGSGTWYIDTVQTSLAQP